MNIKENLYNQIGNIDRMIDDLDNWLASLSFQRLDRINPYQFSLELNYNERDCLQVFVEGVKQNLFNVNYEIRDDEDRYLGTITEQQYKEFSRSDKSIYQYSRYTDQDEEVFSHNIEIWFSINMKPAKIPGSNFISKKVTAPPLTVENLGDELYIKLMSRG